jgi:hypothetical protein
MASNLLDLVDRLIGNVLQGNIFTNSTNYLSYLGNLVNPVSKKVDLRTPYNVPGIDGNFNNPLPPGPYPVPGSIPDQNPTLSTPYDLPQIDPNAHPPQLTPYDTLPQVNPHPTHLTDMRPLAPQTNANDHRPLNFSDAEPPHPHSSKAGMEAGRSLFPLNDTHKMHDARYAFLNNNVSVSPTNAVETPAGKRAEIYSPSTLVPSDVNQQLHGPISSNNPVSKFYGAQGPVDKLDTSLPRNDIYAKSDDSIRHNPLPGPDITAQSKDPLLSSRPEFVKGSSFDPERRKDIYNPQDSRTIDTISNIGGATNISKPSLGDLKALQHLPPAPSLNFRGPTAGDVPNLGDLQPGQVNFERPPAQDPTKPNLKGNLYDDGPISLALNGGHYALTEGFIGPLRNFDIFAIAHWVRNIGSEIAFLPKWTTNPNDSSRSSFQGPVRSSYPGGPNGAETLIKSAEWLATNLLLTSLNTGDPQAYGPLNLVWNPLSLLTAAVLPARGISPTERPSIGNIAATYKDNLAVSVAASTLSKLNPVGERLLLMRSGFYSEVAPIKRLQQLQNPIMAPGFRGDMNGATNGGDTLHKGFGQLPNNPLLIANTIEDQTGGLLEEKSKLLGVHTNVYTADRPYSNKNAVYPLEKFENDFIEMDKLNLIDPKSDIKTSTVFKGKPFPGSGILSSGKDMTYVLNPIFQYQSAVGIRSHDTPTNVDAEFIGLHSGIEDENGTINASLPVPDDENYMPFSFQDLRDAEARILYLRAFLKGLTETFTPEWNEDRFYGRTEPVPIYKGTMRTINLSFDMVAWSPKDLPFVYKKLSKLQSMVYPLYDDRGFLKAGPIIRMRIGDLIAGDKNLGLSGFLTSLDLNYDKSIWNIKKDFKVPQHFEVSLGFTALHETNPGLYKDSSTNKVIFGTANISSDGTKVENISEANIRKIFKQVKDQK